jgi:hypothetical protein
VVPLQRVVAVTLADHLETYLSALSPTYPYPLACRLAVRALLARDAESRWWEVES